MSACSTTPASYPVNSAANAQGATWRTDGGAWRIPNVVGSKGGRVESLVQWSAAVVRLDLAKASIGAAGDAYRGVEGGGFGGLVWWRFHIANRNHTLADMTVYGLTHEAGDADPYASCRLFQRLLLRRCKSYDNYLSHTWPLRAPASSSFLVHTFG
jgi:hypothetical protein